MVALHIQCKIALFRHQLLQLGINGVIVGAANVDGLRSRILGSSRAPKTCNRLSRELTNCPFRHHPRAIVVEGFARFTRFQSQVFAVDLNGVIQSSSNADSSRRIRGTLTWSRHQRGHIDAPLEIRNTRSDLRHHRTAVTVGDEHVWSFVVGQRGYGRCVLGETRRWNGTISRTRQVDGFPRDPSSVQLRGDVAPTPRATPRAVHEDVRRRSHGAIFLDQGSDDQTLECLDGAAF